MVLWTSCMFRRIESSDMATRKPKFKCGDIVWFFDVDDDMEPSEWIRKCRVEQEATAYFDPIVADLKYDIPYRFRARENQLFKTERAAHKHFCEWAEKIVDHERSWLLNHKEIK